MRLSSPGAHRSISVVTTSSPGALPMFIWFKTLWSSGKGGAAVIQEDMCAVWAVFLHTLLATGIAPLWISRKCCRQDWASPNGFSGKMLHLHTAQASDLTQQLSSAAQAQSKRLTKIKMPYYQRVQLARTAEQVLNKYALRLQVWKIDGYRYCPTRKN